MDVTEAFNTIATKAGSLVESLIHEARPKVFGTIAEVEEASKDSGKDPVLTMGFNIKLNTVSGTMTASIGVGVKQKIETSCEIDDPNQEKMSFDEDND